jgi:hypothetical protein
MSFFPDIILLTSEVKKVNQNQARIIALLQEQNQLLKELTKK